jgi:DNA polymerase-1
MNFKDIKNSLKLCTKIVKRMGLEQYRVRGEEGDDIIASYIHQNPDAEYLILSNDKDFFQLLNKNVRIIRMNRGESVLWTRKSFKKEFGFKSKYFADYLAIIGDSVDKIPGIKGIGSIIGSQIFQQISKPNIKNIMNKVNDLELSDKQKEKILTGKKDAELFFKLTKLSINIELKPLFIPKHNIRKLINLFIKLEFRSIYENEKNMTTICDLKSQ